MNKVFQLSLLVFLWTFKQGQSADFNWYLTLEKLNTWWLRSRLNEGISPSCWPGDGNAKASWLFLTKSVKVWFIWRGAHLPPHHNNLKRATVTWKGCFENSYLDARYCVSLPACHGASLRAKSSPLQGAELYGYFKTWRQQERKDYWWFEKL